jgi:hypothetical protein
MTRKKNKKILKRKPPFYWPFILLVIILIEIALLINERAWSQAYGNVVYVLRDQVEKINIENKLMFNRIFYVYNQILNASYFAEVQRIYLVNPQLSSLSKLNEKKY